MKTLKQILLITIFVVGLSFAAMAQKQDDKKNPPKDEQQLNANDPDKPKDDNKSNEDKSNDNTKNKNRPKKPQAIIFKRKTSN